MSGREDRRRRVLREDAPVASGAQANRKLKASAERYTDQAKYDQLPRLVDLVPKRPLWLTVWFFVGLVSIGALYVADFLQQQYLPAWTQLGSSGFQLQGYATLASWWSTTCLLGCTMLGLTIYSIRCHRVDDYRAKYRQWLMVSGLCLIASAIASVPLHRAFEAAAVHWTGRTLGGRPALWWMIPVALVYLVAGIRMILDMRPCKSGPFFLILGGVAYVAGALGFFQLLQIPHVAADVWAPVATLLGHYCLFWSLCMFARYVYLDAQGELAVAVAKKRRKPKSRPKVKMEAETEEEEDSDVETRPKPSPRRSKKAKADRESEPIELQSEDDEMSLAEMELLTNPDLTRGERRKLRKKLKRERRAA